MRLLTCVSDSYNGCPTVYSQPTTITAQSTAPQLNADAPSEVKFPPSSESLTSNARYNIIRSVCLPKIEVSSGCKTETDGSVDDSRVKVDKTEAYRSETGDLCEKSRTDANGGGLLDDPGISENPVRDEDDTSKESCHDDERDFVTGCSPIDDGYDVVVVGDKSPVESIDDAIDKSGNQDKKEACHSVADDLCDKSRTDANEGGFFGDRGLSENPVRGEDDTSKESCHDDERDIVTGCSPIDDGYDVIVVGDESPVESIDDAIDKSGNQTDMVCDETDMVIVIDDLSDETDLVITSDNKDQTDTNITTAEAHEQTDTVITIDEDETDTNMTTAETCDQTDANITTDKAHDQTDMVIATDEDETDTHDTTADMCDQIDAIIATIETPDETDTIITTEICDQSDSVIATSETHDQTDAIITTNDTKDSTDTSITTETCDRTDLVISSEMYDPFETVSTSDDEMYDPFETVVTTDENYEQTDMDIATGEDETDTNITTYETHDQPGKVVTTNENRHKKEKKVIRLVLGEESYSVFAGSESHAKDMCVTPVAECDMSTQSDVDFVEGLNDLIIDMDEDLVSHDDDNNNRGRGKRGNSDVCATSKDRSRYVDNDSPRHDDVRRIGVLMNGNEQVRSPEIMPISVIVNVRGSEPDAAPESANKRLQYTNRVLSSLQKPSANRSVVEKRGPSAFEKPAVIRPVSEERVPSTDEKLAEKLGAIRPVIEHRIGLRVPSSAKEPPASRSLIEKRVIPRILSPANEPTASRSLIEQLVIPRILSPTKEPTGSRSLIEKRVPSPTKEPTGSRSLIEKRVPRPTKEPTGSRSLIEKRVPSPTKEPTGSRSLIEKRVPSPTKEPTGSRSLIEKRVPSPTKEPTGSRSLIEKRVPSPTKEPTGSRSLIEKRVPSPTNEPTGSRSFIEKRVIPRILSPTMEPTRSRSLTDMRVPSPAKEPVSSRSAIGQKTQHKSPLKIASAVHQVPNAECETSKRKSPKSDVGCDSEKRLCTDDAAARTAVMQRGGVSGRGSQFNDRDPHKHSRGGDRYEVTFGPCYPEQNAFQDPAQRPCQMDGGQFGSHYHEQNAFQDHSQRGRRMEHHAFHDQRGRQMEQNAFHDQRGRQMEHNAFQDRSQRGRQMEEGPWSPRHDSRIWERERFGMVSIGYMSYTFTPR